MDQVNLRAEMRTETGSRPTRRLRRDGRIPAVVYGRGVSTVAVTVTARVKTMMYWRNLGG